MSRIAMRGRHWLARDEGCSQVLAGWSAFPGAKLVAWLLARSGDSIFWLAIAALLMWRRHPLGLALLTTLVLVIVATALAKGIFRRQRPQAKWAIATDKYAFPSGHAARAAAVAVTLGFAFPGWMLPLLLWAVGVGLARVVLGRHYISDVVAGLAFGFVIGFLSQGWL